MNVDQMLVGKPKRKKRRNPSDPTVVLVDGKKCLKIELTKGFFALIDECDANLAIFLWAAAIIGRCTYAKRSICVNGKKSTKFLHHEIMPVQDGFDVDHKNGDGLDNRRCNLRIGTRSQNSMNNHNQKRRVSLFKGVIPHSHKWMARAANKYLGLFNEEIEAAHAYDKYVVEKFGDFATPNFPKTI